MRQLHDDELLQQLLTKHGILNLFETTELPFRLYQYDKGEIIRCVRDSAFFLQFFVQGSIQIYSIRSDGSQYPICVLHDFTVLGDMEFCGADSRATILVEVCEPTLCVELPLHGYQEKLENDNTFLRFLLHAVVRKLSLVSQSEAAFSNLEEKLLHYLTYECENHQFQGVERTAFHLRCSRRQLQRLLKSLTEQGIIEKLGKGNYRLRQSHDYSSQVMPVRHG